MVVDCQKRMNRSHRYYFDLALTGISMFLGACHPHTHSMPSGRMACASHFTMNKNIILMVPAPKETLFH
jgi:hypothetical protein